MVTFTLGLLGCTPEPLDDSLYPDPVVSVSLFDPPAGAMVHPGAVTVRGEVKGLTDLRLDGVLVEVDGNLWQTEVELPRGITTFEVGGLDATGHRVFLRQSVLAGDYGDPGADVPGAVGVRLNMGALNATSDLVAGLVDPAQVQGLLPSLNPVYSDSYGVFGIDAVEVAADLQSVWFSPLELTLDPGAGAVDVEVRLPDLEVVVPVYGQAIGIDFDTELSLTADAAVVRGFLELGAANGKLTANLVAPTVELQGFVFDTTALPGSIEDALLSGTIRTVVEDLLTEQVSAMVPSLLDDQLSTLAIAFDTELLGKQLSLEAGFADVWIDRDGIELAADVSLGVEGPWVKNTEGWLRAPGADVGPDTGPDLAVGLSDELVNRLLHDLWRVGLLDLNLSSADGSLDPLLLAPLGAKSEGSLVTDADLPPILIQSGDEAVLQLGEFNVTVDTPGGANGEHLEVTVSGQIPVDLEIVDSALTLALGTPALQFMVRDNDWGGSDETLTSVLESRLPVASMLALVGDLEIPLPEIYGLTLPDARVDRDDAGLVTTIDLNL
ncbi:MAG: hypothetical protein ABMA64_29640 [Myxococcota bacterium]